MIRLKSSQQGWSVSLRWMVALVAVLLVQFACANSSDDQAGEADQSAEVEAAPAAPEEEGHPLADTSWRLVQFESMDDAVGVVAPDESRTFTMTLNADGTVAMTLDCNKANGSWTSEPGEDGQSGTFEFGPLATTRALCPPPNLDERIARDAEYIRSYMMRDGRLHLSLMADGGIYTWEPDESLQASTEADASLEDAIRTAEPDYTAAMVGDGPEGRYAYARADLNGDDQEEVFVYLLGPAFCGSGGCNLLLFSKDSENGYQRVAEFPISRFPVIVSAESSNGWRDLFRPESGGGAKASFVRHTFDGTNYVEAERLPGDSAPQGVRVLTNVSFETGLPLAPAQS